jgi:uncharacterized protein (DUF4415 family)
MLRRLHQPARFARYPARLFLGVALTAERAHGKAWVHLRLDADMWHGSWHKPRGHLSRMNAVLRCFTEPHRR